MATSKNFNEQLDDLQLKVIYLDSTVSVSYLAKDPAILPSIFDNKNRKALNNFIRLVTDSTAEKYFVKLKPGKHTIELSVYFLSGPHVPGFVNVQLESCEPVVYSSLDQIKVDLKNQLVGVLNDYPSLHLNVLTFYINNVKLETDFSPEVLSLIEIEKDVVMPQIKHWDIEKEMTSFAAKSRESGNTGMADLLDGKFSMEDLLEGKIDLNTLFEGNQQHVDIVQAALEMTKAIQSKSGTKSGLSARSKSEIPTHPYLQQLGIVTTAVGNHPQFGNEGKFKWSYTLEESAFLVKLVYHANRPPGFWENATSVDLLSLTRELFPENYALLVNKKISSSLFTDIVTNLDTVKIKDWSLDILFCSAFFYLIQEYLRKCYHDWDEEVPNGLIEDEFLKKNPLVLEFSIYWLNVNWPIILKLCSLDKIGPTLLNLLNECSFFSNEETVMEICSSLIWLIEYDTTDYKIPNSQGLLDFLALLGVTPENRMGLIEEASGYIKLDSIIPVLHNHQLSLFKKLLISRRNLPGQNVERINRRIEDLVKIEISNPINHLNFEMFTQLFFATGERDRQGEVPSNGKVGIILNKRIFTWRLDLIRKKFTPAELEAMAPGLFNFE